MTHLQSIHPCFPRCGCSIDHDVLWGGRGGSVRPNPGPPPPPRHPELCFPPLSISAGLRPDSHPTKRHTFLPTSCHHRTLFKDLWSQLGKEDRLLPGCYCVAQQQRSLLCSPNTSSAVFYHVFQGCGILWNSC